MRALLLCVGRLKEPYLREACAEYEKRLTRFASLEVAEVKDEPDTLPPDRVLRLEGEKLLARIRPDDRVIALAIQGRTYTSEAFAAHLRALEPAGRLVFVIGGSLGLSPEVYARADERLSFSTFTFPHQLMRVVFLEQLYRASMINAGSAYHK